MIRLEFTAEESATIMTALLLYGIESPTVRPRLLGLLASIEKQAFAKNYYALQAIASGYAEGLRDGGLTTSQPGAVEGKSGPAPDTDFSGESRKEKERADD